MPVTYDGKTVIHIEIDRVLQSVTALNDFSLKHGAFLVENDPDLCFCSSESPSVHFGASRADKVAAYFGNENWSCASANTREKVVDGVRVVVYDYREDRAPKVKLVSHIDAVGGSACKASVESLHSLN